MFQMKNVGRKIAKCRKERGMTQMELANQMGISFQAVSNWERGSSMPDISKLPELAEILGVSIDQLLGEEAPLVKAAADNRMEEFLEATPVKPEELKQAAPILHPEQVEKVLEKVEDQMEPEDIVEVAPFLEQDTVDAMAIQVAEKPEKKGEEIQKKDS